MILENRFALVTGAARGIGQATALALARAGANVAINYESHASEAEEVGQAVRDMGRQALVVQADVSDSSAVARCVAEIVSLWGRIDILVNNAGVSRYTPFLQISEEEWDRVLAVDLKGQFLVGQQVARQMVLQKYGRIVNISSIAALLAYPGLCHYQVAKAGVVMLTKGMALELSAYGITVNTVAPGTIITDMNRHHWADPERRRKRLDTIAVGRLGEPDDVAATVVHLASDSAAWVTGAVFVVDGGQTIRTG